MKIFDFDFLLDDRPVKEIQDNLTWGHFYHNYKSLKYKRRDILKYFQKKGGNGLSVRVYDRISNTLYAFVLVGSESLLNKKDAVFTPKETKKFQELKGCEIIAFGCNHKVVRKYLIEHMIKQLYNTLDFFTDMPCTENDYCAQLKYDYVWLDCPDDKMELFTNKYHFKPLEINSNTLFQFLKR